MTLIEEIGQFMETENRLQIYVQHSKPNVRKKHLKHRRELSRLPDADIDPSVWGLAWTIQRTRR